MKCQKCNDHIATIHLTEIVEGKRKEMHLCQTCAQDEGVAIKNQVPLNELLNSLLAVGAAEPKQSDQDDYTLDSCSVCGMTWEKFKKLSLLGCPNDYDVFAGPLESILSIAHEGNNVHIGKTPSKTDEITKKQVQLLKLKKQLETAIKTEDYETAAKIRDQIKNLGFDAG